MSKLSAQIKLYYGNAYPKQKKLNGDRSILDRNLQSSLLRKIWTKGILYLW